MAVMPKTTATPAKSGEPGSGRWKHSWRELVDDVLDPNLCTGCSGCILACPRDVLRLDHTAWRPELLTDAWGENGSTDCIYTARGCTMCARACPRLGTWEAEADVAIWGRSREPDEILGIYQSIVLVNATDPDIAATAQDGGLATALLAYALEHDVIDAALVSYVDQGQTPRSGVARTRKDLLAAAGSRYTYSANTLAFGDALDLEGVDRLGLVSVGCQTSIPAVCTAHGARRVARRFALTIGLLCSSTFDESIYDDLIHGRYGVERSDITKVNIKGRLQIWTGTDSPDPDVEIPLKECRPFRRAGCTHCTDFSAAHADISLGGIGKFRGTTLAIIRSDLAADLVTAMEHAGLIEVISAAEHDPSAIDLITKLAATQRKRFTPPGAPIPGNSGRA